MPAKKPKTKPDALLTEQARPMIGSIISPTRISSADGLTPARLASLVKRADQGNVEAYLILAAEIEERDSHLSSVISTRKLAVSGSPVHVEAASDSAHDRAIAEDVEQLVKAPEFSGLVLDLLDGLMKGFSAVEIIWNRDVSQWTPLRYEFREQRHFVFDADTLTTPRLRSLASPVDGEELKPFSWIVHKPKLRSGIPIRTGLARTASILYAAKRFDMEAWMKYLDVFSVPTRLGKYPSSAADQKRELLRAIQQIGVDACAVIPEEMTVELLETKGSSGNNNIFSVTADYFDQQMSKLILGQTLTSDSGGGSYAQGRVHNQVRQDIRKADALAVAATINRDLIKVFIDLNYGPQQAYPIISIQVEDPEDITALMTSVKTFVNLGGRVEMSSLRDRLGLPEPAEGAELLQPEAVASRAVDGAGTGVVEPVPEKLSRQALKAQPETVKPQTDLIEELLSEELKDWVAITDPVIGEAIRRMDATTSYDEAKAILDTLDADTGEILDLTKLVKSLSKRTLQSRGIGDQSDMPNGDPALGIKDLV